MVETMNCGSCGNDVIPIVKGVHGCSKCGTKQSIEIKDGLILNNYVGETK
jgi:copper chaperone CopZ